MDNVRGKNRINEDLKELDCLGCFQQEKDWQCTDWTLFKAPHLNDNFGFQLLKHILNVDEMSALTALDVSHVPQIWWRQEN